MKHKSLNKLFLMLVAIMIALSFASCNTKVPIEKEESEPEIMPSDTSLLLSENSIVDETESIIISSDELSIGEAFSSSSNTATVSENSNEEKMIYINITVGDTSFTAVFYNNEATQSLIAKMPMTIDMNDVNGNEKVYQLSENLPSMNTEKPDAIHAGEIMCWSGNNLVLFYDTFPNSYGGYIRLGYIEDVSGLASALGTGNANVTFSVSE